MSHTLHREGTPENLKNDFVVMIHPAQGHNVELAKPAAIKFLELAEKHGASNIGVSKAGNYGHNNYDIEKMKANVPDWGAVGMAVFNDAPTVIAFLRDLKAADVGISTVVTGIFDTVKECAHLAGLEPHTVNMSYGIYGKTEYLADKNVREVSTMCGHGFVTAALVLDMVDQVKSGRKTSAQAAEALDVFCHCGIFNKVRAAQLIDIMAAV